MYTRHDGNRHHCHRWWEARFWWSSNDRCMFSILTRVHCIISLALSLWSKWRYFTSLQSLFWPRQGRLLLLSVTFSPAKFVGENKGGKKTYEKTSSWARFQNDDAFQIATIVIVFSSFLLNGRSWRSKAIGPLEWRVQCWSWFPVCQSS